MEKIFCYLKEARIQKALFALVCSVCIFVYPEYSTETVGAFLTIYGIIQTKGEKPKDE